MVLNLVNNGIIYLSTGARFLPSTVVSMDLDYWIPSVCHFTQLWISHKRPYQQTTFWLHNFDWLYTGCYTCHIFWSLLVFENMPKMKLIQLLSISVPPDTVLHASLLKHPSFPRIGLSTCWSTNISERDAGSVGFLHLLFFHVFSLFSFPPFHMSKSQGKPKRNKKNNPVRRIWSKSIPDCFFVFFCFHRFSRGFLVSQAPTVQKLEENQKNQKNQSCEKNLG